MNATHETLVKFDRRGRLRYAPEQKAALVEAYAASGLSGPKFAALLARNNRDWHHFIDLCVVTRTLVNGVSRADIAHGPSAFSCLV